MISRPIRPRVWTMACVRKHRNTFGRPPSFATSSANRIRCGSTSKAGKRLDAITGNRPIGNQAFVAMRFHDDMVEPYEQGIEKALRELGWDPKCVKYIEHNGKIDDLIIAEIRKSALLIADFTSHRPSVYFEAGLAVGLGIPVIWTFHDEHLDDLHFDTRQYSHVHWSTSAELYERLKLRAQATVPRAQIPLSPRA